MRDALVAMVADRARRGTGWRVRNSCLVLLADVEMLGANVSKYWREIGIVLLIGLVVWMWHDAQMSALKADLTNQLLKQQRTEVKQETQQKVEEVKQERKAAKTPEKQVEYIERYVPVHITSLPFVNGQPPDAPSAVIAQADLPKLADYVSECETCKVERAGLQKQVALCDQQVKALEKKSGGFWSRAKWFVIGSAAGAGVIAATRR